MSNMFVVLMSVAKAVAADVGGGMWISIYHMWLRGICVSRPGGMAIP